MKTLGIATVAMTMAVALHAEEPWLNASTVSGPHDVTVLLAGPYE